jgi:hypothetical protein
VKKKMYKMEKLGFASNWSAPEIKMAIEKKMLKNEENGKYSFDQPVTKPKKVSDNVGSHAMLSNLRVRNVHDYDPYLHQDIPGETSGRLLKNNNVKNEGAYKRRLYKRR